MTSKDSVKKKFKNLRQNIMSENDAKIQHQKIPSTIMSKINPKTRSKSSKVFKLFMVIST